MNLYFVWNLGFLVGDSWVSAGCFAGMAIVLFGSDIISSAEIIFGFESTKYADEKSLKDKEMGKSTRVIDKLTSALEAPFSDKTYAELKKEKRAAQKKKYENKNKK